MPERIQLRRTKGWRKPEGAIVVSRPSKFGNPYVLHRHVDACYDDSTAAGRACPGSEGVESRAVAVLRLRHVLQWPCMDDPEYPSVDEIRDELAGRDLACWCPLDAECHADVLLEIANS